MKGKLARETKETRVEVSLGIDGSVFSDISTGIKLLDEMLRTFAEAASFDLAVKAAGDLETGDHHTTEDVGITMGSVIAKLANSGIGSAMVPAGEAIAVAAIRLGDPGYKGDFKFRAQELDGMSLENIEHFLRALAYNGRFTLHIKAEGEDDRSKIEAISMAAGRALKNAMEDGVKASKKI
ncbi:MAG: imidazoleglycerol-phosphate dehydratase [Methanotrichaceae archaeon]